MIKRLLSLFLAIILCLSCCGCLFRKTQGIPETDTFYYNYNSLTYLQQNIYDEILKNVKKMKKSFSIFDIETEDMQASFSAIVQDHPELFWISDGYKYTVKKYDVLSLIDFNIIELDIITLDDKENLGIKEKQLQQKLDYIVNKAKEKENDYEKVLFVYNYIIENTEYDSETAEKLNEEDAGKTLFSAQTAYGCLVENKAICSGYSKAFQLILQKLGYVCGNAFGSDLKEGTLHQWNFALLEDDYYYFDLTWGDQKSNYQETDNYISYEFFAITTDELLKTHKLEENQNLPECVSEKYNYYRHNGYYCEKYSFKEVKNIINNQKSNGYIAIKFSNNEECKKAISDLFKKRKILGILNDLNSLSYFQGYSNGLLVIIADYKNFT